MKFAEPPNPSAPRDLHQQSIEGTGLPGFRTWSSVYAVVAGSFFFWVILLVLLYQKFS